MAEQEIGKIDHYYSKISVAVVELTGELSVGDRIHIKGQTTDFTMIVDSMQVDHNNVEKAGKGDSIGMKVPEAVRDKDKVFKVTE